MTSADPMNFVLDNITKRVLNIIRVEADHLGIQIKDTQKNSYYKMDSLVKILNHHQSASKGGHLHEGEDSFESDDDFESIPECENEDDDSSPSTLERTKSKKVSMADDSASPNMAALRKAKSTKQIESISNKLKDNIHA
jgi:hypothetical protein